MIKEVLKKNRIIYSIWRKIKYERIYGYKKRCSKRVEMPRKIAFIVSYPQGWNSLKTVYESAKEQAAVETVLIACTACMLFNDSRSAEFWKEVDPDVIVIGENDQVVKLRDLNADIIFRQTSYDIEYPPEYSAKNIIRYSKLCYIAYGYDTSPRKHLEIEYNSFFPYCYSFFADNNNVYKFLQEKKKESKYYSNIKVFNYGFPRFDLIDASKEELAYTKYLYIPRWSMDAENNDASTFFMYMDNLINLFSGNDECELIIRPHPGMFPHFIQKGFMTEEQVGKFKEKIAALSNICLDENKDYMLSFKKADILIADFSSIIIEFFLLGKPIIYCGDIGEFYGEMEDITNTFYKINNWAELDGTIKSLMKCDDPKLENRLKALEEFRKTNPQNAGKKIIEACMNEI